MSNPKRHHFVPESYLNGFVEEDGAGFLNIYSKKSNLWRRQKPKQVMVRNKYYHQDWAPEGVDKNIFEKTLGSDLEPKGLSSLRKLIEAPENLDDDDTANILVYLQFQRIRVCQSKCVTAVFRPGSAAPGLRLTSVETSGAQASSCGSFSSYATPA